MTHTDHNAKTDQNAKEDSYYLEQSRWMKGRNVFVFLMLVSWIACGAGFALDRSQFFRSYLVSFAFSITIVLASLFFVMVQYLTGSAWSVTVRRFMENIMVSMPAALLLFIPIALGLSELYPWTNHAMVAKDPILSGKAIYLNEQGFTIRGFVFILLWSIWAIALYRNSVKQDTSKSIQQMHVASRWSAPGLFLAVVVGSLAAFDWLMSLDPKWYSTIFGLFILAGGAVSFFATITLICLGFRRAGVLTNSITTEHYHDLGKWMFSMTAFYAYIAFSQYLLIWYANLPEETIWFRNRMEGSWLYVSLFLPFGAFFIPFFTLLARGAKRKLPLLATMAVWILTVHYIDMYYVIMPTFFKKGPELHWLDLACLVAVASTFGFVFWTRFQKNAMVVIGDLRFKQGLHFENA